MLSISKGLKIKDQVVQININKYKEFFIKVKNEVSFLDNVNIFFYFFY